ncbi:hypothetical protein [Formosa sp. PL04]|uniref:hypothetical protein n=1 Tax=Formosa sp. PL04 TaxID=3081755 RepID=UPI0029817687|nr:hypothetical protein [Formosa sp. PL04]MDW5290762.1 hypothetical protein [Formosa sp. PL04]
MNLLLVYTISFIGLCFLVVNTTLFLTDKTVRVLVSKTFLAYLVSLSFIEISCNVIGVLYPNSNLFISHFYFIFQFVFMSSLYYTLFKEKKIKQFIVLVFVIELMILGWIYYSNPQLFWEFNIFEIVSTSFILVFYALVYIFKNLEVEHKYFNFSIGLILYLCCSITIFLSGNLEMVLYEDPFIDIWIFNSLFYIIFQYMVYREYLFFKKQALKISKN